MSSIQRKRERERGNYIDGIDSVLKNCISLIKIAKINIILEYSQCGWITCDLLDTVLHTQVRAHTHTHTHNTSARNRGSF